MRAQKKILSKIKPRNSADEYFLELAEIALVKDPESNRLVAQELRKRSEEIKQRNLDLKQQALRGFARRSPKNHT